MMNRFWILTIVILGAFLLPGCQERATGTLSGTVSVGPLQPVQIEGQPEPTPPPEVFTSRGINIYKAGSRTLVKKVMFSAQGDYQVELPVGSYVVDLVPSGIDVSPQLPADIEIEAGETTILDIEIDTGIR